ncbi:DUF1963 domain-containing protein [Streptomyces gobiensis]|uniref:DUF1963 domain-containing protein n=1 Tax=Streptomyces gobiensis TaxID=2875706 RepID=UPI001E57C9CB|nr:DUF1963 domain-containing protein [Streptomyces gobiensis]UGY91955.1 DUF1963 domain-containing protein [Streptomyces gobiensis]
MPAPAPAPVPIVFVPASADAEGPSTRIGGQPAWLEAPQWPLSRELGEPMRFFGQFRIDPDDEGDPALAYLFITDGHTSVDGTYDPEGGENALVVQPGGRLPDFVRSRSDERGPTFGTAHVPSPAQLPAGQSQPWQFLGGPGIEPVWLQGEETPGPDWQLVVQLDSGDLPFPVDFGDGGVGYAFVSPDRKEGRFLWQST